MEQNERRVLLNSSVTTKIRPPTFNGSVVYGTHDGKMVGRGKRNGKMA